MSKTFELEDCKVIIHVVNEKAYLEIELPDGRSITFTAIHICKPPFTSVYSGKQKEK